MAQGGYDLDAARHLRRGGRGCRAGGQPAGEPRTRVGAGRLRGGAPMSMMRGRRDLTGSARPNSMERAMRKLGRRVQKIERAPTRQIITATPVAEIPIPSSPAPVSSIFF